MTSVDVATRATSRAGDEGPVGRRTRVVLVVGGTSGIGAACVARLRARGDQVFAASRRASGDGALRMDVDDDDSVERAVGALLEQTRTIDAMVYSAGHSLAGPVEATTAAEVLAQLDTNFVGLWRVCRAVLPVMREQRRGHIIAIGSLAGRIGLPFQAAYCASKFAMAGFAESLRAEVMQYGVRVAVAEPGNLCTPFTTARRISSEARDGFYGARFLTALARIEREERDGGTTDSIAALVERMLDDGDPPPRRAAGPVLERLGVLAAALLPRRLVERAIIWRYGGWEERRR